MTESVSTGSERGEVVTSSNQLRSEKLAKFTSGGDRFTDHLPRTFPYRAMAEVIRGKYLRNLMTQ